MLLIFGLSITPKLVLHQLFANHKDTPARSITAKAQLTTSGFHCDIDNLVVEGPFLTESITLIFNIQVLFATYQNRPAHNFASIANLVSSLRGPPSIA
jgi:hypothetical protein